MIVSDREMKELQAQVAALREALSRLVRAAETPLHDGWKYADEVIEAQALLDSTADPLPAILARERERWLRSRRDALARWKHEHGCALFGSDEPGPFETCQFHDLDYEDADAAIDAMLEGDKQ